MALNRKVLCIGLIVLMLTVSLCTCRSSKSLVKEVDGIVIPTDLFELTKDDNAALVKYIRKSLQGDRRALIQLIHFDCGGAAGCYDLGTVLVQVVSKLGKDKTNSLIPTLNKKDTRHLVMLLQFGLEYGGPPSPEGLIQVNEIISEYGVSVDH